MSASEVIVIAKKFLQDEAEFDRVRISSVVGVEAESQWKVVAVVGQPVIGKKEMIIDDEDGKIVSYKEA